MHSHIYTHERCTYCVGASLSLSLCVFTENLMYVYVMPGVFNDIIYSVMVVKWYENGSLERK